MGGEDESTRLLAGSPPRPFQSLASTGSFKDIPLHDDDVLPLTPREREGDESPRQGWLLLSIALLSFFVFYIAYTCVLPPRDIGYLDSSELPDKCKIYLRSPRFHRYVTVESEYLTVRDTIPWLYGSGFEVNRVSEFCFLLKTSSNAWLRYDPSTGELRADGTNRIAGSQFAAVHMDKDVLSGVAFKLCNQNKWVAIASKPGMDASFGAQQRDLQATATLTLQATSSHGDLRSNERHGTQFSRTHPKHGADDVRGDEEVTFPAYIFFVEHQRPIRGVNLGGWFVPEQRINPAFFANFPSSGRAALCRAVNASRSFAEKRMSKHLASWVSEDDYKEMAHLGYNSVRVPLGYWNVIEDPHRMYAPNLELSLQHLDNALRLAQRYNMTVLLDLHGAPGSQNGMAHSGCDEGLHWLSKSNLRLTLEAIEAIAQRYGHHPALLGIELVNEPSEELALDAQSPLVEFYRQAYRQVRKHCRGCHVVINSAPANAPKLGGLLAEPEFYNVLLDVHLYDSQEPHASEAQSTHLAHARAWAGLLESASSNLPVVVGEWSMSTGARTQISQSFVAACTESFKSSLGWYVWTWKVDAAASSYGSDVQQQYSLPNGIRPL